MIKVVYFVSITLLIINLVFAIINFETLNLVLFISQSFVLFAIAVISNNAIKNQGIKDEINWIYKLYESLKEKK
jgi:predicted transcriptional regulator